MLVATVDGSAQVNYAINSWWCLHFP